MKILLKTITLLFIFESLQAKVLLPPVSLSKADYNQQLLESYDLKTFTDYYLESPVIPTAVKKLRKAFTEANNLYLTGDYNKAVIKLKKVMSYRYSADWTKIYRDMIALSAKRLSSMDTDNKIKWLNIKKQFNQELNSDSFDLSEKITSAIILVNGVEQGSAIINVPKGIEFRLTIISNKYLPFSIVTDFNSLNQLNYIKTPFVNNNCQLKNQSPITQKEVIVAYSKHCKNIVSDSYKELLSESTTEAINFKKYSTSKIKKNKWLLIGAGVLVGSMAYYSKKSGERENSSGF